MTSERGGPRMGYMVEECFRGPDARCALATGTRAPMSVPAAAAVENWGRKNRGARMLPGGVP